MGQRWRKLAAGTQRLSELKAAEIAGEIYRSLVIQHGENPGQLPGRAFHLMLDQMMLKPGTVKVFPMTAPERVNALIQKAKEARRRSNDQLIDDWLQNEGMLLDPESRHMLGKAVDKAILLAREQLGRMAGGDWSPDPNAERFPTRKPADDDEQKAKRGPLRVFDDYVKGAQPKPRTVKRWRPIWAAIDAELGRVDSYLSHRIVAARVTTAR